MKIFHVEYHYSIDVILIEFVISWSFSQGLLSAVLKIFMCNIPIVLCHQTGPLLTFPLSLFIGLFNICCHSSRLYSNILFGHFPPTSSLLYIHFLSPYCYYFIIGKWYRAYNCILGLRFYRWCSASYSINYTFIAVYDNSVFCDKCFWKRNYY